MTTSATAFTLEFVSPFSSGRMGNGIPGMAWQSQQPVFLEDLGKGPGFLRADSAVRVGNHRGFALPRSTPGNGKRAAGRAGALPLNRSR